MSTFQYLLWSSCSVQLSLQQGWSFCWYKSATVQGLIPCERAHNHGEGLQKLYTGTNGRLFWFCLLQRLMTFSLSALLFRRLVNCCDFFDLSERQVRLPFHFVAVQIVYWIWVLEVISTAEQKGSGHDAKPKVRKHKQKQIQPSSSKHELMVQVCCTRVTKINSWCTHGLGGNNCLWNN